MMKLRMYTFHVCVERLTGTIFVFGEVKILRMLLSVSVIHRGQCVVRFDERQSYQSFLF